MPSPSRILIVGGGIAGLAPGRALREQGVVPDIIERAASWPSRGTGLYLPGTAFALSERLVLRTRCSLEPSACRISESWITRDGS
jgi:2-polyprenyl-6-methoxyphenol hydroxylase-like FAD-dependent oxidoreductase